MLTLITKILSAWPMVIKRSLANWKLLSSVVIGVLLASAIMAGTVIYFDSLKDLALKSELSRHDQADPTNPACRTRCVDDEAPLPTLRCV